MIDQNQYYKNRFTNKHNICLRSMLHLTIHSYRYSLYSLINNLVFKYAYFINQL